MSEIVIRHVEARDAEPLRLMSAQPEMYHHLLQLPYPSQELWQERVKPRPGHRMLVATIDGEVAGHIGISVEQNPRRSHAAEFGLAVSPAFRQRGVASALNCRCMPITKPLSRSTASMDLRSKAPPKSTLCATASWWTPTLWHG